MSSPALSYYGSLSESGDSFIEIDYFQSALDTNFTRSCCPCLPPDKLQIRLKVSTVTRRFFSVPGGELDYEDERYGAPVTLHDIPYISKHRVCPVQLRNFMEATRVPYQSMSRVLHMLMSFARQVVPVVSIDDDVVVRPFTMEIKLGDIIESGTSDDEFEIYEDCFQRVRLNDDNISGKSCSICFEDFATGIDLRRLPCSHIYHGDCIVEWLRTKPTCPLCRLIIIY